MFDSFLLNIRNCQVLGQSGDPLGGPVIISWKWRNSGDVCQVAYLGVSCHSELATPALHCFPNESGCSVCGMLMTVSWAGGVPALPSTTLFFRFVKSKALGAPGCGKNLLVLLDNVPSCRTSCSLKAAFHMIVLV